ncbi:NUDIX domain-containing protein (plasmid) [Rhizobium leguminosarum]|uniref:NUDIX hydrolase n=1 Tax=Rhizobium leguminosarum TaxID=384 RepID=UPI00102FD8B5|nr:NUDIX domain-containing protein [Rhizobium leguminosarum]TAU73575.1 NUDIX domain-containing protein [Rhizobium leguminosarum]TAV41284.1 NUDIX domain-containing protein [Rhizobium leguminosarum]TAX46838.1 NUDIX domain-containing protein [Rhizobium leguminosarum]TAX47126.1 NUDIX domain-containing protein [Rhizobium leguminosarum]TAX88717.1 NUDIX domain-containing protein [Rhizobium leguminosarum]
MKNDDKRQKNKAAGLLQQLALAPETLFKGAFLQQYGAVCFRLGDEDKVEILLVTSRQSRRWVIPKGWPIRRKKPFEAAATEAWEEAGVQGSVRKKPIGRYTYLKELGPDVVSPCMVDLFQIEVKRLTDDFKERGERVLVWVSPDEAARRVRELEPKSLLVSFRPHRPRARIKNRW